MHLVVYGDFNCPFSCLASARVDALLAAGIADVEWRAVEHDPLIARPSEPVTGELWHELDREVDLVRSMVRPHETFPMRRPPRRPNTALAIDGFVAAAPEKRHALRRRLFGTLWFEGADIGDPDVLRAISPTPSVDVDRARIEEWRAQWRALPNTVVPSLVREDGTTALGLDALTLLGDVAADADRAGRG